MLISDLAKEVHENAVAHGWWEEERKRPEILALIHSEWSEALEEARAGRPMVWYACGEAENSTIPCNPKDDDECRMYGREGECQFRGHKPEGIAVELIDGCIRILDYIGQLGGIVPGSDDTDMEIERLYTMNCDGNAADMKLPELVAWLHLYTAEALKFKEECPAATTLSLLATMSAALGWVNEQGIDPLQLLLEKHEYNKTRPYKHGKKF